MCKPRSENAKDRDQQAAIASRARRSVAILENSFTTTETGRYIALPSAKPEQGTSAGKPSRSKSESKD
jgi:hypothetical protein